MHISTPIEINIHPHYTKYTHKCLQDWGCHFTFFFLYSYYFLPGVYCSLLSKWFIDWIELFRSHSSLNDTIPHVVPGPTQGFLVMEATFTSTFPRLPRKAKLNFVIMTQNIQGVHAGRCWGLREASKGEVGWGTSRARAGFGKQCARRSDPWGLSGALHCWGSQREAMQILWEGGGTAVLSGCIPCPILSWLWIICLHNQLKKASGRLPPGDVQSIALTSLHSAFLRERKDYWETESWKLSIQVVCFKY